MKTVEVGMMNFEDGKGFMSQVMQEKASDLSSPLEIPGGMPLSSHLDFGQ